MASLLLLPVAAVLALLKGFDWEEAAILMTVFVCPAAVPRSVSRAARLTRMEVTPGWMVSAIAAMVGAAIVGWWSFQNVDYGEKTFLGAIFDPGADAARAVRSSAAAAALLLAFGVWRLVATPAPPRGGGRRRSGFQQGARDPGRRRGRRAGLEPGAARRQAFPVLRIGAARS